MLNEPNANTNKKCKKKKTLVVNRVLTAKTTWQATFKFIKQPKAPKSKWMWCNSKLSTIHELHMCSFKIVQMFCILNVSQPHFEGSVRSPLTLSKNGTWESSGTPENSERNCRGQKTLHSGVLCTVGKVLKWKCPKWPRMSHLDICSTSYGRKKGRESNWQFDSRPLKVGNQPDPGVCRWNATHCWKALKESYKFSSNLVPIGGWSKKLWMPKVSRVQTGTISGLHFGSREKVPFGCK